MARLAHVFICYGSVSWDAAVRIGSALGAAPDSLWYLVLFPADITEAPRGSRVFYLDARRSSEWSRAFRTAEIYSRLMGALRSEGFDSLVAYVPHPFEVPANDLVYSQKLVRRRELLPDGMINYIKSPVVPSGAVQAFRYFGRSLLRLLAARSFGFGYRILTRGTLTQVESVDYDRAHADRLDGFLAPPCGVSPLPPKPSAALTKARSGTLVLDQELGELATRELETWMRVKLLELLKQESAAPIYYKAHPRGLNRCGTLPPGTLDVSARDRAEDVIERLAPARVIGFYSTPLLFPSAGLERVAILPPDGRGVRKPELLQEVRSALMVSGVRIVSEG